MTERVRDVVIQEVDLASIDEADVVALNTFGNILRAESHPEDPPTPVELTEAGVRNIPGFVRYRVFWARDPGGAIAATADASWTTTPDNEHLMRVGIDVRPDGRRTGLARELLRRVAEVSAEQNRTTLMGGTTDRVPAGEIFARRVGAGPGLREHTNRLVLADVDRAMVERWLAEGPGRAPGYSLIAIDGVYPDELIEQINDLGHVMNTAPRDDLDMEDSRWSVDDEREAERSMLAQGTERWSLYARHDATGELVGWTEVGWNPRQPETVWQWGTGVRPTHRGYALGKWLKAAMLARVLDERHEARDIRTDNANSNDAMLGINHQLGFVPYVSRTVWQVKLEQVLAYLSGS